MAAAADLLKDLKIKLPGSTDDMVKRELLRVLDEFLMNTNAWTEDVSFNTVVGQVDYTITATDARIVRLMSLSDDEALLERRAVAGTMPIPGTVRLGWSPTVVEGLIATVTISVRGEDTLDSATTPDWIFTTYYEVLLNGVLGRMHAQYAKPYSNERLGILHGRRFRSMMATARAERQQAFKFRQQPWTFPQGFARMRKLR